MKLKKTLKLIALVAILAVVFSLAACDLFKAKLELKSFTVDRSSVKTNYLVGEEIDFSGIKATAKYSDESLNKTYTYNELTITYAEDITATEGDKEVTVSFTDPHLNVKQETKVAIKVTAEPVIEQEVSVAVQFEKPAALTKFDGANNVNTALKYGDAGFASEFAVGGKTYIIGNENAFRFNPQFAVLGDDDNVKSLDNFFSVVELSVMKNGEYVVLTATAGEGNLVSYYDGETLIATVDTYKGLYNFSADAAGLNVKISVLPSEEYYIFDGFNPVVLRADIIKAYNIYEAWELAVIDNDNTDGREGNADWNDTRVWETFKAEKGIANVTVSGIVLHADLHLTANDVPEAFFMTTTKDIIYTNDKTSEETEAGETKTIPAGTKYLRDWSSIYRRLITANETFVMEGNFFSISLANFPLVPSPAVFGQEGVMDDYGSDFSNSDLFRFNNETETALENYPKVTINNLNIIGNAARDNWRDAEEKLVSAGGLIFLKANDRVAVDFDNIIGNSFFITYFADDNSIMNIKNAKCYDSYQNAIYMWGDAQMNIVDSYFSGAGGPMAIVASPYLDGAYTSPNFVATNTIFETHVNTKSVWIEAVNGTAIIAGIDVLSQGLEQAGLGSLVYRGEGVLNNTMNIQGLLMPEGSDAEQVIIAIDAQGSLYIDGKGIDRNPTPENVQWATIKYITQMAIAGGAKSLPPFLTVYDANGTAYTLYSDGVNLYDLTGAQFNPYGSQEHAMIAGLFMQADTLVLSQGGISVVLEFYH